MKNRYTFFFAVLVFIVPISTHAVSGACSYHDGVNCAIENIDGNAVCNDGYVSSIQYTQMYECQNQCQPPISSGCTSQSQVGGTAVQQNLYGMGNTTIGQGATKQCQDEVIAYQSELEAYNSCLSEAIHPAIVNQTSNQAVDMQSWLSNFQSCQKAGHSYLDDSVNPNGQCVCWHGYGFDSNGQCVPSTVSTSSAPIAVIQQTTTTPQKVIPILAKPKVQTNNRTSSDPYVAIMKKYGYTPPASASQPTSASQDYSDFIHKQGKYASTTLPTPKSQHHWYDWINPMQWLSVMLP